MNNSLNVVAIVGSVLIPLLAFMFALRPWIRDIAKVAGSDVKIGLASLNAELKAYREGQKELIEVYKRLGNLKNPHPNKENLLDKLKNDTITREEALELQQMMKEERQTAEGENDFLKVIVIIGILALITHALTRSQE